MVWPFGGSSSKSAQLGIDLGTSFIRVVMLKPRELRQGQEQFELKNYGHIASDALSKHNGSDIARPLQLDDSKVVNLLKHLLAAMGEPMTKRAVMTLPVFASFLTEASLPIMSERELSSAVPYQARSLIPVDLSEVELDWQVVERTQQGLKVLLAAVPKQVIERYRAMAKAAGLELVALEIETFALVRALSPGQEAWVLVDMGAHNTAIAVVFQGAIRISRNIDASGSSLTKAIAQTLDLSFARSEALKRKQGLLAQGGEEQIVRTMEPILEEIVNEIDRAIGAAFQVLGRRPTQVILTGGAAQMRGLLGYLQERLRMRVSAGNPWQKVVVPPLLEPVLEELSFSYAVAVGAAMRQ